MPDILHVLLLENPIQPASARLINASPALRLFGHVPTMEQAVQLYQDEQPDIILVRLDGVADIPFLRALRLYFETSPVVVFSSSNTQEFIQAVLTAGAMGFLLGEMPPPDVAANLLTAYQGQIVLSTEIVPLLLKS